MRIAVVDFAASNGGALSILKDFYEYIKKNDHENEWIFFLSEMYIEETKNIKVELLTKYKQSWFNRLKFDYIDGKSIIEKFDIDIIYNLQNTLVRGISKKQILYIHQSLPFQKVKKFSFFKKREMKMAIYQNLIGCIIKNSIKKADFIIVQTNWMKRSILDMKLCSNTKIKVIAPNINISNNLNESFKPNSFFYPASEIFYKNHKIIDEAIKRIDNQEVLDFEVEFTVNNKNLYDKKIKCIGILDREEVYKKYKQSVLIFPSYIETFGLPLAEARVLGSLIIAADTEFAREILDGYKNAYFFKYYDYDELARLMIMIIKKDIIKNNIKINKNQSTNSCQEILNIILNLR